MRNKNEDNNIEGNLSICQKCKARCCKMGGADFSKKEMLKVLDFGAKNYFEKINENHYELKSKKGICPYLSKENSCSIHNVRPNMCKCWPIYATCKNNQKQFFLIQCPLTSHLSDQDIKLMKKQAEKIDKKILKTSISESKLKKSDLRLIKKRIKSFKRKKIE